jgi:oligopeptide/dipeptide ABC transporter ATP-binding protein
LAPTSQLFTAPRHPYTRALLDAVPHLDPDIRRARVILDDEPPSAARLPNGCVFSSRCPQVQAACRDAQPVLQQDGVHAVACRRWREIARSDQTLAVEVARARSEPALASEASDCSSAY